LFDNLHTTIIPEAMTSTVVYSDQMDATWTLQADCRKPKLWLHWLDQPQQQVGGGTCLTSCSAHGCLHALTWHQFPLRRLWQVVSLVNLNQFIAARGYTFFLGAIYLMFAGLLVAVGLSIWVAQQFQANRFDHVWWVLSGAGRRQGQVS
jgi:hypothetical protein